jgi:hypothetical protein
MALTQVPSGMLSPNTAGNGPAFSAYYTGAGQSVTNATDTKTILDTKEFDTGGCFNNTGSTVTLNGLSVPSYSFCPNVAGYYQVNLLLRPKTTTNFVSFWIILYKNGSIYVRPTEVYPSINGAAVNTSGSVLVYLNGVGDYISLYGYINSGGTCTFDNAGTPYTSRLQASLVRAA